MGKFRLFIHLVILATTPTFLLYPHNTFRQTDFHIQEIHSRLPKNVRKTERYRLLSYDDILNLLDEIESGAIDFREKDVRRINRFMAYLSREGVVAHSPNSHILNQDIRDLLAGDHDDNGCAFTFETEEGYEIIPAINRGEADMFFCKSKVSKKWKKTKKFIKKHKKEIIIGAVIVVATATVIVAVVVTSSAGAAVAAAGAAGAASSSKPGSREEKDEPAQTEIADSFDDIRNIIDAASETPTVKAVIDEQIASFREFMIEDQIAQQANPSQEWDELSFIEKAREVGTYLAHEAYTEITELFSVAPQLCEEIKDLGSKFMPDDLVPPHDTFCSIPKENYEKLVTKGHQAIDTIFSSDQAELFTTEARANDPMNDFAIGMIPLPGGIPKLFSNTSNLIKAGNAIDRAGFTRVGRGLMKHGYREGSLFPKPLGTPAQINQQGEAFLKEILHDPKRTILKNNRGGIEIYSQSGRGAYFREDGTFRGFIEYGHK